MPTDDILLEAEDKMQKTEHIVQQEAPHARAGVQHGKDEERLKHNGEVIPNGFQAAHAQGA